MIARSRYRAEVEECLRTNPVVALLGPRQTGKTTLARQEPKAALEPLRGLVILDEVQRRPELFALLRVLADRQPLPARFLILGYPISNSLFSMAYRVSCAFVRMRIFRRICVR